MKWILGILGYIIICVLTLALLKGGNDREE